MVFPIIYRVSYIPGGAGFQPSTVSFGKKEWQVHLGPTTPFFRPVLFWLGQEQRLLCLLDVQNLDEGEPGGMRVNPV